MTILERIYREPAALLAFATATCAVLAGVGVLSQTGVTIALGVVAGAVGLLRYFVTPAGEVLLQQRPDGTVSGHTDAVDAAIQAGVVGPAVEYDGHGAPISDERGASDIVTIAAVLVIVCAVVWLVLVAR